MEDPLFTWAIFGLVAAAYAARRAYLRGFRDGRRLGTHEGRRVRAEMAAHVAPPPVAPPPAIPAVVAMPPDHEAARRRASDELLAMGFPPDMVARGVAAFAREPDYRVIRERVARSILAQ